MKTIYDHKLYAELKKDLLEYGVTPLEALMLQKIARSEYTGSNGAEPEKPSDTCTYADVTMETAQDKGVFVSLMNKGLVHHWDYSTPQDRSARENLCQLSDIGFEVYKKLFPQPKDPHSVIEHVANKGGK